MNHTGDWREELAGLWPRTERERWALLTGLLLPGPEPGADFTWCTQYAGTARLCFRLLRTAGALPALSVVRVRALSAPLEYRLLLAAGSAARSCPALTPAALFLRGVFLARGSLSAPGRPVHLEMVLPHTGSAAVVARAAASLGVDMETSSHRDRPRLYLKDGDRVAGFLGRIGAHRAVLLLEAGRAERDMRARLTRVVNAETANLRKTVVASVRQCAAVRQLKAEGLWDRVPAGVRAAGEVRLAHPDAALVALGQRLGCGKSAMARRLRALERCWATLADTAGRPLPAGGKQDDGTRDRSGEAQGDHGA